jgi:hypothetical protein
MRGTRRPLVRAAAWLLDPLRRWLCRRSDRTWMRILTLGSWLAPYPIQRRQLRDLAAVMREGPAGGSLLLRRAVADTTREELLDAMWALRHLRPMDPTRWDDEDRR